MNNKFVRLLVECVDEEEGTEKKCALVVDSKLE